MSLQTIKPISLDLYNNVITNINTKQLDTESRYLKITCTENGKKIVLNSSEVKAFVRYKKPDGHSVLNEAAITDDGCILAEFTQQMLSVSGRANADVILIDSTKPNVDINENTDFSTLKTSILSTMYFNVIVHAAPIQSTEIESSYEYNALLQTMTRMIAVETELYEFKDTIIEEENQRQANEAERASNEAGRITAEEARETAVKNTISECNTAINNKILEYDAAVSDKLAECDTAITNAETATTNTVVATNDAITATGDLILVKDNATSAAERAEKAAENCENITDIYLHRDGGTVTGTLILSKSADLSGDENSSPALVVGGEITSAHMEMDNDEVQSKTDANTVADMWLNKSGGTVNIGAGGLSSNGSISSASDIKTSKSITIGDFVLAFDAENKRLTISQA